MTTLYIRDVPDEVAESLKNRAAENGQSLSAFVARELGRIATRPGNDEIVARLRNRKRASDVTTERIVHEVQQGRR